MDGIGRISSWSDSAGPIAKSAGDVAMLTEIVLNRQISVDDPGEFEQVRVGFGDSEYWKLDDEFCKQYPGTKKEMVSRDFAETFS